MAVADATAKPSPPPPRFVIAALALVPFLLVPMLALLRVVRVAAQALPYLCYAAAWVLAAASAAKVVAARAWGDGSAPAVFLQALTDAAFTGCIRGNFILLVLVAVLLCCTCLAYAVAAASGPGSEFKKDVLGAFKQHSAREYFPRTAVLGWVASVPFMLLLLAGYLVERMMPSPVDRSISKGEMIGSVIVDVGVVGTGAISCFVVIPALALCNWRHDQSDRKAGLAV